MNLADTHTHLYWDSFKNDFEDTIKRAIDSGVTTIINVGVDIELSKKAADQVKNTLSKIPNLKSYSTIGIHPHEATKYLTSESIVQAILQLENIYKIYGNQLVAIGECGLDFFFDNNPIPTSLSNEEQKELQKQLFQAQINLAKKLNLPLIVHCRDDRSTDFENSEAWDEVLEMINNHPTILHCYSGLIKTTQKVLGMPNTLISFAATLTYPKNDYLRKAAKILPLEKIVLETDCPFLPPQSKRGEKNEPANILEIAQLISELRKEPLEKIAQQTTLNAEKIFNIGN